MANPEIPRSLFVVTDLLFQLYDSWNGWDDPKTESYYLTELVPSLVTYPRTGTELEGDIAQRLRESAGEDELRDIVGLARKARILHRDHSLLLHELGSQLLNGRVEDAQGLMGQHRELLNSRDVSRALSAADEYVDAVGRPLAVQQIQQLIDDRNFAAAAGLIATKKRLLSDAQRLNFGDQIAGALEKLGLASVTAAERNVVKRLYESVGQLHTSRPFESLDSLIANWRNQELVLAALQRHDFVSADSLQDSHSAFVRETYEVAKATHIRHYFLSEHDLTLNEEQSIALSVDSPSLLVRARAGSGKTRLLICKAILLIEKYGVSPREILFVAFNRKAAREIRERLSRDYAISGVEALTFHSLAWHIVRPDSKILYDHGDEPFAQELSAFVQDLIRSAWNPAFTELLYDFFRKELAELDRAGVGLNRSEYLQYRRGLRQYSLQGEAVKSQGEKYIADFLWEHNISYWYERAQFVKAELYRPDFTIYHGQCDYVIEHWALDPADPTSSLPPEWEKTSQDYREEIVWKRAYWKSKGVPLVETCAAQTRSSREAFEVHLKRTLEAAGIECHRLSDRVLQEKLKDHSITRFAQLAMQFIQKCRKRRWSPTAAQKAVKDFTPADERSKVFLDLVARLYLDYEAALAKEDLIDFDILIERAAAELADAGGNHTIFIERQPFPLPRLKYLLVDEYQDFTQQFDALVLSLRQLCPELRSMCVGDDWQAINAFAGSDLSYFSEFRNRNSQSMVVDLSTNHRSSQGIVEAGNRLMEGRGVPAKSLRAGGSVEVLDVEKTWIEVRTDSRFTREREHDLQYRFFRKHEGREIPHDQGELQAKTLKTIHEVMLRPENVGCSAAILSRTSRFHRLPNVGSLARRLGGLLNGSTDDSAGHWERGLTAGTVHSHKGTEADVVFIVRTVEGAFPLVHPDHGLWELFGESVSQILEEERRLFYVAVTRARDRLYCLIEGSEDLSPFVTQLFRHEKGIIEDDE